MLQVRRALKDVLAGGIFIAFGLAFAFGSLAYDVGTPLSMGPGYVPLALGLLLAALGAGVVAKGIIAASEEPIGGLEWRALVLIVAALLFFGITVRGLGVAPALFGTSLLATFARARTSPPEALAISVGLTILSLLIFVVALGMSLPLVGPWIPL